MTHYSTSTIQLDLHLSPQAEQKLHAAATVAQCSVSEFVLESALIRADETLADRTRFVLDANRWDAFIAALDAEPRELPRLQQLFRENSVFEARAIP